MHRRTELAMPLLWALTILAAFWAEVTFPRLVPAGELNADRIWHGHEWWRCATALFLHTDTPHLVSNALAGVFAFSAMTTAVGRARGWLLLLIASVIGNLGSAALNYGADYHSIGASTAVFAAVGVLTGRAVRRMAHLPARYRWRAIFGPLGAGITVVALYGAGGVHIDVPAHCAGFAAGLLVGFVAAFRRA